MAARSSLLIMLGLLLCSPAHAFVGVASDGHSSLRSLDLVIAEGPKSATYTLSPTIDLRGRRATLLVPVPANAAALKTTSPGAVDAAFVKTSPRLEVYTPKDPCADIDDLYELTPKVHPTEAPGPIAAAKVQVSLLPTASAVKLDRWAKTAGLKLDAKTASALSTLARRGQRIIAYSFEAPKGGRGLRLPPIQWQATLQALPLALGASHSTPGQVLPIRLVLGHAERVLRPQAPIVDMGTSLSLPEVAFEDPRDLSQAAIAHLLRRRAKGSFIHLHTEQQVALPNDAAAQLGLPNTPTLSRYETRVAKGADLKPLTLKSVPFTYLFYTRWWIRRVWRQPLKCEQAARYQNIVRIQQRSELIALTALTGRPLVDLQQWSVERGYAQDAKGRLKPLPKPLRR